MLPMSLTSDDGPIYVNAKQYHGIIRRRQIRAKAMMENKLARTRKVLSLTWVSLLVLDRWICFLGSWIS